MRSAVRYALPAAVSALLIFLLAPATADACGESLFRLGKGVHYRAYSAPIPGTILVYVRSEQERDVADQLQKAGHDVVVVNSEDDLAIRLNRDDFDVLVAPVSLRAAYESGAAALTAPPDWVPVFEGNESDSKAVRAEYGRGVYSDDDVRLYLKAIHRSLKSQGS